MKQKKAMLIKEMQERGHHRINNNELFFPM